MVSRHHATYLPNCGQSLSSMIWTANVHHMLPDCIVLVLKDWPCICTNFCESVHIHRSVQYVKLHTKLYLNLGCHSMEDWQLGPMVSAVVRLHCKQVILSSPFMPVHHAVFVHRVLWILSSNQFQVAMEAAMDTTEGSEAPPPTLPQDEPPSMEEATAVASTLPPPPDPLSREDGGEEKGEVTVSRLLFCWISRHLQSCCLSRS